MTKSAFEKIKAGLEDAKAYLDGSADKRRYGNCCSTELFYKVKHFSH